MKQLAGLALFVLLITACSKNSVKTENKGITGKWKLTEYYMSTGGPGSWQPYTSLQPVIIQFTEAGEFFYTPAFSKASLQLNRYSFAGGSLTMSSTVNGNTDTWTVHSLTAGSLDISVQVCFEGCAYRFTAVE